MKEIRGRTYINEFDAVFPIRLRDRPVHEEEIEIFQVEFRKSAFEALADFVKASVANRHISASRYTNITNPVLRSLTY